MLGTVLAAVAWSLLPTSLGRIFKHEIIDGKFREVSCTTLSSCLEYGLSTPGMLLHRTWAEQIEEAVRRRAELLQGMQNESALLARQTQVRFALQRRFLRATLPDVPPNVRMVRRFEDEDRGVSVTMLLFESWKGQAVPAVLFVPLGAENLGQKLPAVLHLPGHLAGSLRDPEEQKMSLGLAQKGFVVLSFDPLSQGERQQYGSRGADIECRARQADEMPPGFESATPSCSAVGSACSKAHNHFGKQLWLLGRGAEELFVRDAQRALDLLQDMPIVDSSRIGAVGCSGGGMLTAYLGAVDSRVEAALVACYFSTLGHELEGGSCNYDAEQIIWGMAKFGIDKPDMLVARAPRATGVLLTNQDCFPFEGGREGFDEVSRAFWAHGEPKRLYVSEALGYHQVTETGLEAMHIFFREELRATWQPPAPKNTEAFPCSRLWFGSSQLEMGVYPDHGWQHVKIPQLIRSFARPLLQHLRVRRRTAEARGPSNLGRQAVGEGWLASLPEVSAQVSGLLQGAVDEVSAASASAQREDVAPYGNVISAQKTFYPWGSEEWLILYTGGACALTLRLFQTTGINPEGGAVALVFGGGSDLNRGLTPDEDKLLDRLRNIGMGTTVLAGLCGQGDQFWRGGFWEFAPLLLGRTHTGFHAAEVLYAVSWAFRTLRAHKVVLVGHGSATSAVLHAAVHVPPASTNSSGLAAVALLRSICCLADVVQADRHALPYQMQMHGVLKHYDLPDLLAALPRLGRRGLSALVSEPRGPRWQRLSRARAWAAYRLAARRLGAAGGRLKLLTGRRGPDRMASEVAGFLAWAVARCC